MESFEFITSRAKIVTNAVPPRFCEQMVYRTVSESKFFPTTYNGELDGSYLDAGYAKIEDKKLIDTLWSQIKDHIPPTCDGQTLIGPHHDEVYLMKYDEGQFFKDHYDSYSTSAEGHQSRATVMICMNTLDNSGGGSLRFYNEPDSGVHFVHPYENYKWYDVGPQIGTMVIFTHRILHEITPVRFGYTYYIRLNVIYTSPVLPEPKNNIYNMSAKIQKTDKQTDVTWEQDMLFRGDRNDFYHKVSNR
jgi:predicted 2-oxoglutarate/Fe(II)-dependent dioxygenase YbiX